MLMACSPSLAEFPSSGACRGHSPASKWALQLGARVEGRASQELGNWELLESQRLSA